MKTIIQLALLLLLVTGCGKFEKPKERLDKNEYSLDGVKLISEAISESQDPQTFLRDNYKLATNRRLLLRLENMSNHVSRIAIHNDSKVLMQLRVLDGAARAPLLKLCSLTRDWMMLATWSHAHPFNNSGRWDVSGGDYDPESCVKGTDANIKTPSLPAGTLHFDITRWFIDYPKGRMMNFGLVLVAEGDVTVAGEKSASYSPRLLYNSVGNPTPTTQLP